MKKRYLYLRDYSQQNKHPVGCLVMVADEQTQQIRYAISVCSPKDIYSSHVARDKATGRFTQQPVVLAGPVPKSSHEITKRIMQDIVAAHSVQGRDAGRSYRAFEAARAWLQMAAEREAKEVTNIT